MSKTLDEAMTTILRLGGDEAVANHQLFVDCLRILLKAESTEISEAAHFEKAIVHGFSYYYWQSDPRAIALYDDLTKALDRWTTEADANFNLVCHTLDFIYFVGWAFESSSTAQSLKLLRPISAASRFFAAADIPRASASLRTPQDNRIAWIAMYAASSNPMSVALHHCAPALRSLGYEIDVYAWRFRDDAFEASLSSLGVAFHPVSSDTPLETLLAIETLAAAQNPLFAICDMNNAVPTALFSRRLAPIQIFLQAGMPAWPILNLDAVLNSFGFDPERAGWGDAHMLDFNPPWDLRALAPPSAMEDIAIERALLPETRLIGIYGRLAKVTEPYLKALEAILLRAPDTVSVVVGGTGDASGIRDFLKSSPVSQRFQIHERFVPGHIWGHLLDLMLDTWPVTGGESCREMLAKGKPVLTLHSDEMPAIDSQRDPNLLMHSWSDYVDQAVILLEDASEYASACDRARLIASKMSDPAPFTDALRADFARLRTMYFANSGY